jgi:peptidoglycan/LPS O-acetylase OafA/YrhL
MPEQFLEFGKSVVAATSFSSNILFWLEAGYFDGPADMKPLLHTWSLAVEEEFYIVFPIFLRIIKRYFNCRWIAFSLPLVFISFIMSIWGVYHQPSATFYLAPTRAWELLLGSLLALGLFPPIGNRMVREAVSVLGLGLIAWSVFTYSSKTPFPGLSALAPCAGAALVMHTGASGPCIVAKLLSARPVVFTGLISYSLYLWHWPLIVFAKYYWIRDLTTGESLVVIAISVLASVLSWRFIEKPFRKKNGVFRRPALFAGAGTVMAGSIAFGILAKQKSVAAAEQGIQVAYSGYLPKLDIFGETGPQYIDSPVLESQGGGTWTTIEVAGARLTQHAFDGFAIPSQVRTARLNLEVALFTLEGVRQNVLFNGINAYVEVLRQNRLVALSRESERTIMHQLNLEDERVQRGSGIAVDVLQAKSRLQLAKERRVGFEGGFADATSAASRSSRIRPRSRRWRSHNRLPSCCRKTSRTPSRSPGSRIRRSIPASPRLT